ncbi:MOSC domain-containing protein [Roseofilum casamattae]|uniref:MOSC domain-containing protein n=1 Tax=Roseofilum casamattae TaxID=3082944 RepID=UPI0032196245
MKVSGLFIYPIKSCGAIPCQQVLITPKGLMLDREWMIVNDRGQFMSQRKYAQMAKIRVQLSSETLTLNYENCEPFELPLTRNGEEREVTVWQSNTIAIDLGDAVAQWLESALELNHPCRLVRQSPKYPRAVASEYAITPKDTVSFADGYPLLLTNTASLAQLNQKLQARYPTEPNGLQVPMARFRPNVVIETNEPFIEDSWQEITIGEANFKPAKPCSRCIVTTTDQQTGVRSDFGEPLKTLATFRKQPTGIMFGQNLIPTNLGSGQIQLGASLTAS